MEDAAPFAAPKFHEPEPKPEPEMEMEPEQERELLTTQELKTIKETIEGMTKFNQIEVLRLLNQHNDVVLNENYYGVRVNLTNLAPAVTRQLQLFIRYISMRETHLREAERVQEEHKTAFLAAAAAKDQRTTTIPEQNVPALHSMEGNEPT